MDLTSFALLQMYEVAASAQNAERVKLESFDGSHGYLHNGLYRDPNLPDILKWENITDDAKSVCSMICYISTICISRHASSAGSLCCCCNFGKLTEEEKTSLDFNGRAMIWSTTTTSNGLFLQLHTCCLNKWFYLDFWFLWSQNVKTIIIVLFLSVGN